MTATYNYLGYGVTDENGIAKLDHDAQGNPLTHSYTGTGAGKVDIVASLDSEIDESSLVSETYEVLDCYKFDNGTTSDHNDIWSTANATLTRSDEYSTVKETTTGTTGVCAIANVPYTDYHIDLDVYMVDGLTGNGVLQLMNSDYSPIQIINGTLGEWKHISLDKTGLQTNTRVRICTFDQCTELRFKNFRIYPI